MYKARMIGRRDKKIQIVLDQRCLPGYRVDIGRVLYEEYYVI